LPFEPGNHRDDVAGVAAALERVAPPYEVPPGLADRVMAAVAEAALAERAVAAPSPAHATSEAQPARPEPGPFTFTALRRLAWPRRLGLAAATVAAIALAVLAGTRLDPERGAPQGTVEIDGTLIAPAGSAEGDVVVELLGTGRQVSFKSSSLPVLPTGEYYELWFVGPGDRPGQPNRISAGTFHPDEAGNSDALLHAAVDPAKYPRVEVTAEPGDGDPAATGKVVLELDARELLGLD
jgi:Anti-sigma-K factor rskA